MACSAYIQGPHLCRNGFPQNAACIGVTCNECGRHSDKAPACTNEDIDAVWINDAGAPRYPQQPKGQP